MAIMGMPSAQHAVVTSLITAAAPHPVPAGRAIAALKQVDERDPATLGRLAYHALTGVAPADEPAPPTALVPGFPPFASEVLMRAISGPDHRRPTTHALLVVLETVPASSWPISPAVLPDEAPPATTFVPAGITVPATAGVAAVATGADVGAEARIEPVAEPEVDSRAEPVAVPEVETGVEPTLIPEEIALARRAERDDRTHAHPAVASPEELHDEFRALLTPSRQIPRFDPLTDPWEPDPEPEPEPVAPTSETRIEATAPTTVPTDVEPEAEQVPPEPASPPRPRPAPEPLAVLTLPSPHLVPEPAEEPAREDTPEPVEAPVAESGARGMHEEFRDFVTSTTATAGTPLTREAEGEDTDGGETSRREARAKRVRPGGRHHRSRVDHTDDDDRQQTLILVAVMIAIIVLGVVYAATRGDDSGDTDDAGTPQGASRVSSQPVAS